MGYICYLHMYIFMVYDIFSIKIGSWGTSIMTDVCIT
jgi:hypothetical protein